MLSKHRIQLKKKSVFSISSLTLFSIFLNEKSIFIFSSLNLSSRALDELRSKLNALNIKAFVCSGQALSNIGLSFPSRVCLVYFSKPSLWKDCMKLLNNQKELVLLGALEQKSFVRLVPDFFLHYIKIFDKEKLHRTYLLKYLVLIIFHLLKLIIVLQRSILVLLSISSFSSSLSK
jgi:hypothetical protein